MSGAAGGVDSLEIISGETRESRGVDRWFFPEKRGFEEFPKSLVTFLSGLRWE